MSMAISPSLPTSVGRAISLSSYRRTASGITILSSSVFGAGGLDDLLGLLVRYLLVVIEPDFEGTSARGHRPQIDRVPLNLGQRYLRSPVRSLRGGTSPG